MDFLLHQHRAQAKEEAKPETVIPHLDDGSTRFYSARLTPNESVGAISLEAFLREYQEFQFSDGVTTKYQRHACDESFSSMCVILGNKWEICKVTCVNGKQLRLEVSPGRVVEIVQELR